MNELDAYIQERTDTVEKLLILEVKMRKQYRDFVVHKIPTPLADRAENELEHAELELTKFRLETKIKLIADADKLNRKASRYTILLRLLREAGLQKMIDQADLLSNEP